MNDCNISTVTNHPFRQADDRDASVRKIRVLRCVDALLFSGAMPVVAIALNDCVQRGNPEVNDVVLKLSLGVKCNAVPIKRLGDRGLDTASAWVRQLGKRGRAALGASAEATDERGLDHSGCAADLAMHEGCRLMERVGFSGDISSSIVGASLGAVNADGGNRRSRGEALAALQAWLRCAADIPAVHCRKLAGTRAVLVRVRGPLGSKFNTTFLARFHSPIIPKSPGSMGVLALKS